MYTLREAALALGISHKTLQRKITAGLVLPSTRHPKRGYLLDDEAIAEASAIIAEAKTAKAKKPQAVSTVDPMAVAPQRVEDQVPPPADKNHSPTPPHPHEAAYIAQIKGLEALVAAHHAQVSDLQARLTAAEATIRACALMAPAAALSR